MALDNQKLLRATFDFTEDLIVSVGIVLHLSFLVSILPSAVFSKANVVFSNSTVLCSIARITSFCSDDAGPFNSDSNLFSENIASCLSTT